MRYAAVVDCKEGSQMVGNAWEPRFLTVTLAVYDSEREARREALDACYRSPRDCRNPRVEVIHA